MSIRRDLPVDSLLHDDERTVPDGEQDELLPTDEEEIPVDPDEDPYWSRWGDYDDQYRWAFE